MAKALKSETIPRAAPLSFTGSTQRIWPTFSRPNEVFWLRALLATMGATLLLMVWMVVLMWYVVGLVSFGLFFFIPRLTGRFRRQRRIEAQRHRELVEAMASRPPTPTTH